MTSQVPNRFREAAGEALPMERFRAQVAETLLATVQDALRNGVWTAAAADRSNAERVEQQKAAAVAADRCYDVIERRHTLEPVQVATGDWRARFSG
jgi:hypothetical protein